MGLKETCKTVVARNPLLLNEVSGVGSLTWAEKRFQLGMLQCNWMEVQVGTGQSCPSGRGEREPMRHVTPGGEGLSDPSIIGLAMRQKTKTYPWIQVSTGWAIDRKEKGHYGGELSCKSVVPKLFNQWPKRDTWHLPGTQTSENSRSTSSQHVASCRVESL